MFERFVAGQLACMRELTLFFAPNINSYKRFVEGSFAPTAVAWGERQPHVLAARRSATARAGGSSCASPGADVNPYLALSALIAAGLHGIDNELELEPPYEGNAYESDKPHVPTTLREARDLFAASAVAREAFGDEVVDHYLNNAQRRARRVRRAPSPTGSGSAASSGCERVRIGTPVLDFRPAAPLASPIGWVSRPFPGEEWAMSQLIAGP